MGASPIPLNTPLVARSTSSSAKTRDSRRSVIDNSWRRVDAINCCQQSTDDRHLLTALSVQSCVQAGRSTGREASRRAGPFV